MMSLTRKETFFFSKEKLWYFESLPLSLGSVLLTVSRLLIDLFIFFLLFLVLGVKHIHSPGPWLFAWRMHDWVS